MKIVSITNFEKINQITGAFYDGELVVIAGYSSKNKTVLSINICENMGINLGKVVAYFSIKISAMRLVLKIISSLSRTPVKTLLEKDPDPNFDWEKVTCASGQLYDSKIHIDDASIHSVVSIRSKCKRLKAKLGLDIVIIDSLQLLASVGKAKSRVHQISKITKSLKNLACELEVPVAILLQLPRKAELQDDKKSLLSDLLELGITEKNVDMVYLLCREEYYKKDY